MTKVAMSTAVPVSAKQVWDLIGNFNAMPQWHPAVKASEQTGEGVGSVRTMSLPDGSQIVEKLEAMDDGSRSLTYSIVNSPLPVANYTSTMTVHDKAGQAEIEWSSDFDPKGASPEEAAKAIQGVYAAGLENLKKMFGG